MISFDNTKSKIKYRKMILIKQKSKVCIVNKELKKDKNYSRDEGSFYLSLLNILIIYLALAKIKSRRDIDEYNKRN